MILEQWCMGLILYLHKYLQRYIISLLYFLWLPAIAANNSLPTPEHQTEMMLQAFAQMLADEKVQQMFDTQLQQKQERSDNQDISSVTDQQRKERFDFYHDYVLKYYPRAFVITNQIFAHLTVEEVEKSLKQLIDLFVQDPWLYFVNDPKKFKIIHYWECIVDQLSIIYDFLRRAYVDPTTKKIFVMEEGDSFWARLSFMQQLVQINPKLKNAKPLANYLILQDFYALSFDYVIKLFNEGILLQDLSQAMHYFSELEFLGEKLRGSCYEQEYAEILKTANELLALFKQCNGLNTDDVLSERMGRHGMFG